MKRISFLVLTLGLSFGDFCYSQTDTLSNSSYRRFYSSGNLYSSFGFEVIGENRNEASSSVFLGYMLEYKFRPTNRKTQKPYNFFFDLSPGFHAAIVDRSKVTKFIGIEAGFSKLTYSKILSFDFIYLRNIDGRRDVMGFGMGFESSRLPVNVKYLWNSRSKYFLIGFKFDFVDLNPMSWF